VLVILLPRHTLCNVYENRNTVDAYTRAFKKFCNLAISKWSK